MALVRAYEQRTAERDPLMVVDKNVAASTQNQALSAILFLYRDVLEPDLPWLDNVVRSKRPARLPVVLTREEVRAVLQRMGGVSTTQIYTHTLNRRPSGVESPADRIADL